MLKTITLICSVLIFIAGMIGMAGYIRKKLDNTDRNFAMLCFIFAYILAMYTKM